MNERQLLIAKASGRNEESVEKILAKAPLSMKARTMLAIDAYLNGKEAEAISLCEEILKEKPDFTDVEYLLADTLYQKHGKEDLEKARRHAERLYKEMPESHDVLVLSGKIAQAEGRYRDAAAFFEKIFPLRQYEPFVCSLYGDALMHLGRTAEALDILHLDIEEFARTGRIPNPVMLNGSFQNALQLDISRRPDRFREDLDLYGKFLIQVDTSHEQMQRFIAETVVLLSDHLSKRWLRKPFLSLLDLIQEHHILTGVYETTLASGYLSAESYELQEDASLSRFLRDYFGNMGSEAELVKARELGEEQSLSRSADEIHLNYLVYNWYMIKYYPGHEAEVNRAKEAYPHTWQTAGDCLARLEADPQAYGEELLDEILQTATRLGTTTDRGKLIVSLEDGYAKAAASAVVPQPVSTGGAIYYRGKKVGRNDPCPCGSGKKYKNCCGR